MRRTRRPFKGIVGGQYRSANGMVVAPGARPKPAFVMVRTRKNGVIALRRTGGDQPGQSLNADRRIKEASARRNARRRSQRIQRRHNRRLRRGSVPN